MRLDPALCTAAVGSLVAGHAHHVNCCRAPHHVATARRRNLQVGRPRPLSGLLPLALFRARLGTESPRCLGSRTPRQRRLFGPVCSGGHWKPGFGLRARLASAPQALHAAWVGELTGSVTQVRSRRVAVNRCGALQMPAKILAATSRLRIVLICLTASLCLGVTAFAPSLTPQRAGATVLRAAACHRPAQASVSANAQQLQQCRGARASAVGAVSSLQMQVLGQFNRPGLPRKTLVMKPQRGAVSAAAPFPSSVAPGERLEDNKVEPLAPELVTHLSKAKALEAKGDLAAAEQQYADACAEFPASGKLWMKRFKLARRRKLYGEAREVMKCALKHNPLNAILWQAWADLERALGRVEVARNLYRKGLEANPRLPSLYNSWGGMERSLGRVDTARSLLEQGLSHEPNSVRLLLSCGVLEDVDGNPELARQFMRRGLLVEPRNAHLLHALGVLEVKSGNVEAAREALSASVQADRDHTKSWLTWGQLEESQGNIAAARGRYVEGCKSRNGRGTVHLWQAWARLEEKNSNGKAAVEVYRKAMLLYSKDSQLMVECAKMLANLGVYAEAASLLRRALDIDPHNPYTYQCLGTLKQKSNAPLEEIRSVFATGVAMAEQGLALSLGSDVDAAEAKGLEGAVVERGGGLGPGTAKGGAAKRGGSRMGRRELAVLLHTWACAEEHLGADIDATRDLFARAVALDAQRGFMWRSFAQFEAANGDPLVARHYFARAVNSEPYDGVTWTRWGEFEQRLGYGERAVFYARRGAELLGATSVRGKTLDSVRPLARRWGARHKGA